MKSMFVNVKEKTLVTNCGKGDFKVIPNHIEEREQTPQAVAQWKRFDFREVDREVFAAACPKEVDPSEQLNKAMAEVLGKDSSDLTLEDMKGLTDEQVAQLAEKGVMIDIDSFRNYDPEKPDTV